MKRSISLLLCIVMVFSLFSSVLAEDYNEMPDNTECTFEEETETNEDLSDQVFEELLGDGSSYQIMDITETDLGYAVRYIAATDCFVVISAAFDDEGSEFYSVAGFAPASDNGCIEIEADRSDFPKNYVVTAHAVSGGNVLSEDYVSYDHAEFYEKFLSLNSDSEELEGRVVLSLGEGSDGSENIAVVSEDVKVVYVDSIDEARISGGEEASLMGFTESSDNAEYAIYAEENADVVSTLESGDKLIIIPKNSNDGAVTLVVDNVSENASLMSEFSSEDVVTVTASENGGDMEEFFDYVRVNVTVYADTDDIDTTTADDCIEFDDTAELMGTASLTKSNSLNFTVKKDVKGVTVKDELTFTTKVTFSLEYAISTKPLKKISFGTEVGAKNVFTVSSNASASTGAVAWKIGEIPLGSAYGISFSVPVEVTFSAGFDAAFKYQATQESKTSQTAHYKDGSYWVDKTSSSSSGKTIETQAKAWAKIGVRVSVKVSLTFLPKLNASLRAEVGLKAVLTAQSLNSTSTYKHTCLACFDLELFVYCQPSFVIKYGDNTWVNKTWSETSKSFWTGYLSLSTSGFSAASGKCPRRQYLQTIKTLDSASGRALSGVSVKSGLSGLKGKTSNSSGVITGWVPSTGGKIVLGKSGYNDYSYTFGSVSAAQTITCKLSKPTASKAVIFTIGEWAEYSGSERQALITQNEETGIAIVMRDGNDLRNLAQYINNGGVSAELEFILNSSAEEIDLSDSVWYPIGTSSSNFNGTFDGGKTTLKGINNAEDGSYGGFFGCVSGAEIHDVYIAGASVYGDYAGGVVGAAYKTEIYDVSFSGTVNGDYFAGGIAGMLSDAASVVNCRADATIGGDYLAAGGIVGSMTVSEAGGRIENCFFKGSSANGICGELEADFQTIPEDTRAGVISSYYLSDDANIGVAGTVPEGIAIEAYALTVAQATGEESDTYICDENSYASSYSLLEALNKWYAENGARKSDEDISESEDGVITIPDSKESDYYNKWFSGEGGMPVLAAKGELYTLTVEYVFDDGTEAKPTVIMYFPAGAHYDIDSYIIPGYTTNDVTYEGEMPATELFFRVIYFADDYDASASQMSSIAVTEGLNISVGNSDDLIALRDYVNDSNHTTKGVNFIQTAEIDMTGVVWEEPIGTGTAFEGNYIGGNIAITNLSGASLFGTVDGGSLSGITLSASVNTEAASVEEKAFILKSGENCTISDCRIENSVVTDASKFGSIAYSLTDSVIRNCTVSGVAIGPESGESSVAAAGGLVYILNGSDIINSSFAGGTINASEKAAGIAVSLENGSSIVNCFCDAKVDSAMAAGVAMSVSDSAIKNVYSSCSFSGNFNYAVVCSLGSESVCENVFYAFADNIIAETENNDVIPGVYSFDADSEENAIGLRNSLNRFLAGLASDEAYSSWTLPATSDDEATLSAANTVLPVFGPDFEDTCVDEFAYDAESGTLSYSFNPAVFGEGTSLVIAYYSANGQLVSMVMVTEAGTYSDEVPDGAASASGFVIDEVSKPISDMKNVSF